MTNGKAIVTFGYGTTFMLGGKGTYDDDPVVTLNFRSREPGPLIESEINESKEGHEITLDEFDVSMIFKDIDSIDDLIKMLNTARDVLDELLNTDKNPDLLHWIISYDPTKRKSKVTCPKCGFSKNIMGKIDTYEQSECPGCKTKLVGGGINDGRKEI